MKIVRTFVPSIVVAAFLLSVMVTAYSQGTNLGTLRGTVTDPNGAVIPNAAVKITDKGTGLSRDVTTNDAGNYEAAALKPGTYEIVVTASGFKKIITEAVLSGAETVRKDIKAEVGTQSETVTVTGTDAGLIQRDQPVISSSLDNKQLQDVPRDSREILEYLYLNPDITQGQGGDGTFKFIGAQSYGATFSLDGQRTNGGIFGEPTSSQPSLETVGELIVLSKNFTAEYSGVANIRIETKRGGADYHGSLFYNNKNSALAARSIQDKVDEFNFLPSSAVPTFPTPYFNLNEVGGSFGGPVPFSRKKTFFLMSYERRWDLAPLRIRSGNLPSSLILAGNFTQIKDANKPTVPAAVVPLLTASELANNTIVTGTTRRFVSIPSRLLNPIALSLMNGYYPHANPAAPLLDADANGQNTNGKLADFAQSFGSLLTRDLATLRVDHDFSDKDKFYAVYNFQVRNGNRGLVANPLPAFGLLSQHQKNHTVSLSYTRLFTNTIVNEARGGINYQYLYRRANITTGQFLSSIGFNQDEITAYGSVVGPDLVNTPGQVAITLGPFQGIPNGGRNVNRPMDQKLATFGDTLTWAKGRHSFKFGGDFVRNQAVDGFAFNRNNPRGTLSWGTSLSNYAQFLLGMASSLTNNAANSVRDVRPALDVSNTETGFFVQDDFKIHPRLTLNLGLRYEVFTPFVDKNDLMVNFDPTGTGNGGRKGRFVVPTEAVKARIHPFFITYGTVTADEAGVGRGLVKTDKNNFAPRLGAAWRVTDKSVIRGGYGMVYPTSAAQGMRDAIATNTFNQTIRRRQTLGLPGGITATGGTFPRGLTPFNNAIQTAVQGIAANAIPFDLQSPRIEQFNVTFEQELMHDFGVRVSYIGSRQHGLIGGFDLNELAPNGTPFGITDGEGNPCYDTTPGVITDDLGNCTESAEDEARRPFPDGLGDFLATYGNTGRARSHALQIEVNRRFTRGLMFNASYTLLDQKSNGLDIGDSSLGGALYNQFIPQNDFSRDSFVSTHRFISYGAYELPFGKGRTYGKDISSWEDAVVGGWDVSWNMFAKSGTGFTPFWSCPNNCGPIFPGNIASGFVDAVGDFTGPSFRPQLIGDPYAGLSHSQAFNAAAFGLPPTGADVFDNPKIVKRNSLIGPGAWGVNLGLRKYFRFSETTRLELGADFNNVFNHPLFAPPNASGDPGDNSGGTFANLGTFDMGLNSSGVPVIASVTPNPLFGVKNRSYSQEGIDNRRSIRLRLRLTF